MSDDLGLGGADRPRPLPPDVRWRIEQALLAGRALPEDVRARLEDAVSAEASPLAGVDAPRALPRSLHARLTTTLATPGPNAWRRRALAAAIVLCLLAGTAALTSRGGGRSASETRAAPATSTSTTAPPPLFAVPTERPISPFPPAAHLGLSPFSSCDQLLLYLRDEATNLLATNDPYSLGLFWGGPVFLSTGDAAVGTGGGTTAGSGGDSSAVPTAGAPVTAAAAGPTSTSNVQEEGVDEPDLVKTEGDHLFVVRGNRLEVVDISGDMPVVLGSMPIDPATRLLLSGDHLLGLTPSFGGPMASVISNQPTTATAIDVSDPTDPHVTGSTTFEGRLVSARLVDGAAQLVVSRTPQLNLVAPDGTALDPTSVIADSTLEQWIGDRPCASVQRPDDFSGFDLLSIYTVDPATPSNETSTSVLAGGTTVYASQSDIYVAEQSWASRQPVVTNGAAGPKGGMPTDATTAIHQFAFDSSGASYVASGEVQGRLLDQFSMSQADGLLRVATTQGWGPTSQGSGVAVLATKGTALVTVGELTGLAPGENITGVRFVGSRAYLVTAVQMRDPLFVIDLSDPGHPTELGRVELPGFSAYVHPLDNDHILAIGPDGASTFGGVEFAAKLFDVSDPTSPAVIGRIEVLNAQAEVQMDHLAFLYWPVTGLAVIPYMSYAAPDGGPPYQQNVAALAVGFDGSVLSDEGTLRHTGRPGTATQAPWLQWPPLWRSVVAGDRLFTVSDVGVLVSDLGNLADLAWTPFASG